VLCPAWVKTRIAESLRNHPNPAVAAQVEGKASEVGRIIEMEGISVDALAERVLQGMGSETFNLFTHPDFWPLLEQRLNRISADYREVMPA
jgi:hypothetical protein